MENLNVKRINESWNEKFNGNLPISYILKEVFFQNWFRVYSLPDGKRYPTNREEEKEILDRHNSILEKLYKGNKIYLITQNYNTEHFAVNENIEIEGFVLKQHLWFESFPSQTYPDFFDEDVSLKFFISEIVWKNSELDPLILSISKDQIQFKFLILDESMEKLYAPYDGGADFILFNNDQLYKIKNEFLHWQADENK